MIIAVTCVTHNLWKTLTTAYTSLKMAAHLMHCNRWTLSIFHFVYWNAFGRGLDKKAHLLQVCLTKMMNDWTNKSYQKRKTVHQTAPDQDDIYPDESKDVTATSIGL